MNWIKVEDELPKKNSWVLCYFTKCFDGKTMILSLEFYLYKWKENGQEKLLPMFKSMDRSYRLEDITHWMPLPNPPHD